MNRTPSLTAVVLTCDRPERCRESVAHNARALAALPQSELLVLNNGRLPVELPERIGEVPIRVISMPRNLGAEARNAALNAARGERLFFLDDDVYIEPEHVAALGAVFSEHPDTGAVGFRIFNRGAEEGSLLPSVFHGCAVGILREALYAAGGYPRGYGYYAEEYHVSFRLRQAGYVLRFAETSRPVQHVRDPGGRSKDHIVYRLVRNNTRLLAAFLPVGVLAGAFRDMLQRYRLVGIKEHAEAGWRQGLRSIPWSFVRGLTERKPLSEALFAEFALLRQLNEGIRRLREVGAGEVVLCGTGRFPSLWLAGLRGAGVRVAAFLDSNSCWENQHIRGIPVISSLEKCLEMAGEGPIFCFSGLSSLPETAFWTEELARGGFCCLEEAKPALESEKDTCKNAFLLHETAKIGFWRFPSGF
ncbi:MAG: glycosyltransferase [Kiritimatiellae bacterium]|nr:glycosyltransferase [Kiritimatiellia bacterium]